MALCSYPAQEANFNLKDQSVTSDQGGNFSLKPSPFDISCRTVLWWWEVEQVKKYVGQYFSIKAAETTVDCEDLLSRECSHGNSCSGKTGLSFSTLISDCANITGEKKKKVDLPNLPKHSSAIQGVNATASLPIKDRFFFWKNTGN